MTSSRQDKRAAQVRMLERLWGLDGRGPARGTKRRALLDAIERAPWMRLVAPETANALDQEYAKLARERARPVRSSAKRATRLPGNGFEGGTDVDITAEAGIWSNLRAAAAEKALPQVRDLPIAVAEDHHALSIDAMLAYGLLRQGDRTARTMELTGVGTYVVECHLEQPAEAFAVVRPHDGNAGQIISLEFNPATKRWSMLCPLSGKRCSLLYLRDGQFASASSNRLVHRSQRKTRRTPSEATPT